MEQNKLSVTKKVKRFNSSKESRLISAWKQIHCNHGRLLHKMARGICCTQPRSHHSGQLLVREFVCRYGVPLEIHSDQGRNFESTVFSEMCTLLEMKKTRTTPYHPQSDGMVERLNRTLEAQLSIFVNDHQTDWDTYLPMLMKAYRTAIQQSTKCSPAKLMFGRELRLPIDLLYGRPSEERPKNTSLYAEKLFRILEDTHDFARKSLELASDKMKSYYDSHSSQRHLKFGDAVWLYNPQRKKGLSPKLS